MVRRSEPLLTSHPLFHGVEACHYHRLLLVHLRAPQDRKVWAQELSQVENIYVLPPHQHEDRARLLWHQSRQRQWDGKMSLPSNARDPQRHVACTLIRVPKQLADRIESRRTQITRVSRYHLGRPLPHRIQLGLSIRPLSSATQVRWGSVSEGAKAVLRGNELNRATIHGRKTWKLRQRNQLTWI
jgi:hypothetical protein